MTSTRREAIAQQQFPCSKLHVVIREVGARGWKRLMPQPPLEAVLLTGSNSSGLQARQAASHKDAGDIGEEPSLLLPVDIAFTHVRSS